MTLLQAGSVAFLEELLPLVDDLLEAVLKVLLGMTDDEKIDVIARRVLNKYRGAFEELAK